MDRLLLFGDLIAYMYLTWFFIMIMYANLMWAFNKIKGYSLEGPAVFCAILSVVWLCAGWWL